MANCLYCSSGCHASHDCVDDKAKRFATLSEYAQAAQRIAKEGTQNVYHQIDSGTIRIEISAVGRELYEDVFPDSFKATNALQVAIAQVVVWRMWEAEDKALQSRSLSDRQARWLETKNQTAGRAQ